MRVVLCVNALKVLTDVAGGRRSFARSSLLGDFRNQTNALILSGACTPPCQNGSDCRDPCLNAVVPFCGKCRLDPSRTRMCEFGTTNSETVGFQYHSLRQAVVKFSALRAAENSIVARLRREPGDWDR
jgi:hypothetical protein